MVRFRVSAPLARHVFACVAAVAFVFVTLRSATAAQPAEKLAISYLPANAIAWDIDVAIEKGFFAKEGFAPERIAFQNAVQSAQLMLTGAVQLATGQIDPFIAAVMRGSHDIAAIAAPANRPDWYLVGARGITGAADLKGKRIGTAALQTGESWLTEQFLARQGLTPQQWTLITVGTTPSKLAALKNGSISAAIMFSPTSLFLAQQGYPVLYRYYEGKPFPPVIYTVSRKWAAKDRNGLRLSHALLEAHLWLLDPAHRGEALAILGKYVKFAPPVLNAAYDLFIAKEKLYNDDDAVDIAGVNNEIAVMVAHGALPKGTVIRPSLYVLPKALGGLHH